MFIVGSERTDTYISAAVNMYGVSLSASLLLFRCDFYIFFLVQFLVFDCVYYVALCKSCYLVLVLCVT